jgi:hypothetical protein
VDLGTARTFVPARGASKNSDWITRARSFDSEFDGVSPTNFIPVLHLDVGQSVFLARRPKQQVAVR